LHNDSNENDVDLQLALAQHLSGLQEFGVTVVPCAKGDLFDIIDEAGPEQPPQAPEKAPVPPNRQPPAPAPAPAATKAPVTPAAPPTVAAPATAAAATEPLVTQDAPYSAGCVRCPQLSDFRKNTVFGSGDPNSRLVFVGEGPGEDEDLQGLPFQGAPGDLFDKILLACGLKREQVYLLNTVKCRPPKNRNPKAAELENCWGYGQQQLDIIQPEFICCMGSVAAKTLLNTNLSIGKLRKRFHTYRGSKVLVTYHPTYLLRTSSAKTHAWEDMKMLMNEMGIEIPKR